MCGRVFLRGHRYVPATREVFRKAIREYLEVAEELAKQQSRRKVTVHRQAGALNLYRLLGKEGE